MKRLTRTFFIILLGCCLPTVALAHKVTIFAYIEGNTVYSESYFSDGKPAIASTVTVADDQGKELLRGTTDANGHYNFPLPAKTDLHLTLDASMGHKATFILKMED